MGKNSLKSKRYIQKAEVFAIALLAFLICFFMNDDGAGKAQPAEREGGSLQQEKSEAFERDGGFIIFFDGEIEKAASRLAADAKKSIKIATYTFAKSAFTRLLEQRAKEDLKVRVVAGKNKDNSAPLFDF